MSTSSPLPSRLQSPLSGVRPASTGNHHCLECKHNKREQSAILSLLQEIKTELIEMKKRFMQMDRQTEKKEVTRGELPEGIQFPLKSFEDVARLEQDLETDPGKRARLECYLAMRGGFSLSSWSRVYCLCYFQHN
ncbi:uncharacterized protein LOC112557557 [Pomacea canaliculata]|uniref:uncharacterized protein LOC112557557 n=1 Tax=Pomacea canaliculata TaxID=400727 RepID=UPI000D738E4D|nr:uncharacterized protein LOC112557557 [Pomacea canaliculata]